MSNVISHNSKFSSSTSTYRTVGDFDLVRKLLQDAPYNIPPHARDLIINQAIEIIENPNASEAQKLSAAKLILEADKRNIDVVKLAMPQRHEHIEVKEMSDEDLEAAISEVYDAIRIRANGRSLERTPE